MSKDQSIIKADDDDDDCLQKTVMASPPPSIIPPPLLQTTSFPSFRGPPIIPPPFLLFSQTTSFPSPPSIPQTSPVPLPTFVNSFSQNPSASLSYIPPIQPRPYPSASPMLARPPGLWTDPQTMGRQLPTPIPLVPRALSGPFLMSAQSNRVPFTPFPEPQLPRVTSVGPLGGSFVNLTASGNQSAVSSVTDAISTLRVGDDKPVSDVSTNVATPAVDQSDAWTAYKTERGPVFYYNAVTGISTCEKPVGCEGKLSMPVQECYLCLIRRLPKSATTKQVREIFNQFGRILDAMVFMNNFTDVSMGCAYIIFETKTARSAAIGCSGMFLGGNMISVCDGKVGFGVNAYEFEDSLFNDCITIGETRKRRPMEWPDCGGSHVEKAEKRFP